MKDGWYGGEKGGVPVPYFLKLIQIKAKPHESDYFFLSSRLLQRIIHCPNLGEAHH